MARRGIAVERRVLYLIDRYLDAVAPGGDGEPREVPTPSARTTRTSGVAWKHDDLFTGSSETRRVRRLVVSTFVAIGNYDYVFFLPPARGLAGHARGQLRLHPATGRLLRP